MLHRVRTFRHHVGGSLATLFALSALPALAMLGAALDYGRSSEARARLQAAADAGALAGAAQPAEKRNMVASAIIDQHMKALPGLSVSKNFSTPQAGHYQVKLAASVTGTISRLIGKESTPVGVTATAYVPTEPAQVSANVCFLVMRSCACADGALRVNSNANVDLGTCEAHVHSTHPQAFILNANATFRTPRVCVRGGSRDNGGSLGGGQIEENCSPVSDPFAGTMPLITFNAGQCQFRIIDKNGMSVPADQVATIGGQNVAVGCHDGLNINGNVTDVTFAPGIHVIRGNMNLMGRITATDVTFYMADANAGLQFNGNAEFYAAAPKTGPTSDILFMQASGLPSKPLVFEAKGGQTLEGLIYLPSYDIHFRSHVKPGTKDKVTWVSGTFIADSNSLWQIEPVTSRPIKTQAKSGGQASTKPPVLIK